MLEIRKSTYSRSYENTFFREFAKHLHMTFEEKNLSGLLIGSPFCEVEERLQIDALLITEQVVCIIDFKNFGGQINLPGTNNFEFGIWTNKDGDQVKGGSSINPFIQLKNQKRRFSEVYNKYIQKELDSGDLFNPNHTVRIVCFQEEIELNGKIPSNEAINFFILNKLNFIEGILDIIDVNDKEVKISPNSFDAFKKVFRADKFKFDDKPLEDKLNVFTDKSATLDIKKLYPDQHSALIEIKTFLENPEQQVFVLLGTTNSGKSYLIPFIQELAYNLGIQETEIFASSSRVAKNLITIGGLERVNSIYSYIYGGQKNNKQEEEQTKENENNDEIEETIDSEELYVDEIPLKNCDNAKDALFIVDESQLVSDSFHQSIDLIFGSGCLLKDFLRFTNSVDTNRKIIFIGDPFQLQLGKTDESPLNPFYLEEAYKLKTNTYQLLDKPDFSVINKEALFCVDKIRNKYFNSLQFIADQSFCFLEKKEVAKAVSDIIHNKTDCHILCFSNEESQKVNYWIKQSIIKNGQDIAKNDLVLFNNNISIEDINDPFAEPKKVYNGQFATITGDNNTLIEKTIKTKKNQESTVLTFMEISLILNETGQKAKVLSFENYRLNPKAELSNNEIIAFKILLNSFIAEYLKLHPFENTNEYSEILNSEKYLLLETEIQDLKQKLESEEKVKTKLDRKIKEQKRLFKSASKKHRTNIESILRQDPSTDYYKFKNFAFLKFGWAMTVHKSQSYKWQEVIFNVEKAGTTNENHFRWLYTGISRARKKVSLINYKPISPFDKTEFIDSNSNSKQLDFFLIAENKDVEKSTIELNEFILSKIAFTDIKIDKVESLIWQERYYLIKDKTTSILSFIYNNKGQFRFPTLIGGDKDLLLKLLDTKSSVDFSLIKEEWRKTQYELLSKVLKQDNVFFSQIIQNKYQDKVKLILNDEELDLLVYYNIDGAFTKIIANYYSNPSIWEIFKNSIEKLKA
jgi:hypothetical protein